MPDANKHGAGNQEPDRYPDSKQEQDQHLGRFVDRQHVDFADDELLVLPQPNGKSEHQHVGERDRQRDDDDVDR
jgi:hypothetical protein